MNELISHEAFYRTAPVTPGLLNTFQIFDQKLVVIYLGLLRITQ